MMNSSIRTFSLHYLAPSDIESFLDEHAEYVLGVVGFGNPVQLPALQCSPLWIDIPVLGTDALTSLEVWVSDTRVTSCAHQGISGTTDGTLLFGSVTLPQGPDDNMQQLACQAYMRIFSFLDQHAFSNLLRVWHYFPQINDDEHGLERYRSFNVGRHEAFVANGRSIGEENIPAASALGSNSGALTIYFIAARQPGKAIENPRQVSAFNYPQLFGPRSPIFVRALSVTVAGRCCLFISGTASIVGYETVHLGNSEKQAAETLLNIRTLLQQSPLYDPRQGHMLLKVYLRHAADLAMVRDQIAAEFGSGIDAVYLHSNICRSDLLLEIEGAYFTGVGE